MFVSLLVSADPKRSPRNLDFKIRTHAVRSLRMARAGPRTRNEGGFTVRRETLAQRRITPIFVPLWFGWAFKTGQRRGRLALFPEDCRNSQTRWWSALTASDIGLAPSGGIAHEVRLWECPSRESTTAYEISAHHVMMFASRRPSPEKNCASFQLVGTQCRPVFWPLVAFY
jgi:hypothetical protein